MAIFGPFLRSWRIQQLRLLQRLARVLAPWEKALQAFMPSSVYKVAASKKPAFMLLCALLLRWPDETCPLRYVLGFNVVGDIENSGLFRPIAIDKNAVVVKANLLGPSALSNLAAMKRRVGPGPQDEELRSMTLEEVERGFADGPFDVAALGPSVWMRRMEAP